MCIRRLVRSSFICSTEYLFTYCDTPSSGGGKWMLAFRVMRNSVYRRTVGKALGRMYTGKQAVLVP